MIAITGGIASGKTVVSTRLRNLGAVVLDADQYARKVVEPNSPGWKKVSAAFPMVIQDDLCINRPLLAKIIFANKEKRKVLEEIVHPLVLELLQSHSMEAARENKVVFADIPLLYEVGWDKWMEQVWVVYVSPEIQLKRLINRAKISYSEAQEMINSQLSLEQKAECADEVINNNGTLIETWEQIDSLWKKIRH